MRTQRLADVVDFQALVGVQLLGKHNLARATSRCSLLSVSLYSFGYPIPGAAALVAAVAGVANREAGRFGLTGELLAVATEDVSTVGAIGILEPGRLDGLEDLDAGAPQGRVKGVVGRPSVGRSHPAFGRVIYLCGDREWHLDFAHSIIAVVGVRRFVT